MTLTLLKVAKLVNAWPYSAYACNQPAVCVKAMAIYGLGNGHHWQNQPVISRKHYFILVATNYFTK